MALGSNSGNVGGIGSSLFGGMLGGRLSPYGGLTGSIPGYFGPVGPGLTPGIPPPPPTQPPVAPTPHYYGSFVNNGLSPWHPNNIPPTIPRVPGPLTPGAGLQDKNWLEGGPGGGGGEGPGGDGGVVPGGGGGGVGGPGFGGAFGLGTMPASTFEGILKMLMKHKQPSLHDTLSRLMR